MVDFCQIFLRLTRFCRTMARVLYVLLVGAVKKDLRRMSLQLTFVKILYNRNQKLIK